MTIHHTVNSGGTSVIVPASPQHVEYVFITGTATYREIVIDASVRSKPGLIDLKFTFPTVDGIQVQVLDAAGSSGGSFTTEDGSPLVSESGDGFVTEGTTAGSLTSFITDGIQLSGYFRASTENTARVTPMLRVYPAL